MSFILVPEKGEDIQINAWNWRPTIQFLYDKNILDKETFERMGCQGCGGKADAALVSKIADVIESQLEAMKPGERLLDNNKTTNKPITYGHEADDLYSATYEWLETFRGFCRVCDGFEVY